MLPQDPVILISFINTKLRDQYDSLDSLCDDFHIDSKDIENKLNQINYFYDPDANQFK